MPSTKPVIHPLESAVGEDAVCALARFRLLTVPQLLAVTGRDEKVMRGRIRQLVAMGFVRCHEFRYGETSGRLHNAYSLTSKGIDWLGDGAAGAKPFRAGRKLSISQAPHRALIVDALIAADKWARKTGQGSPQLRTYMQDRATRLELPTGNVDADGILELVDTQGRQRVYALEVYCDYLDNGNGKPFEKLPPYIKAGVTTALDVAMGITPSPDARGALVLVVCDSPKMRDRILKGLPKREGLPPLDKRTWLRFLFKSPDELGEFGTDWHRVDGSKVNLPT